MDAKAWYLVFTHQLKHRRDHHIAFEPHQTSPAVGSMAQGLAPGLYELPPVPKTPS
jgi:hypothetical protein